MSRNYNIAIVDDHPIVIEGLSNLLREIDFIEVKATFNNGNSILEYQGLKNIDVILLDVFLSDSNGIDVCLKLKRKYPALIILAMSSQSERSIIMQMLQNGANGFLLKSASLTEFKNCILEATEGKKTFCNQVKEIIDKVSINDIKNIPRLTLREKEVLLLLRDGKSTQEISDILHLSFLTIQTHRRNLLNKYQSKNVVELLNYVKTNGLL